MKFFYRRFEDGTLPYLSIVSLLAGYETIEQLIPGQSMQRISRHCFNLAKYLYESLKALKYSNGRNVVHFYHDTAFESIAQQGAIVNFNILHEDQSFVGFSEVYWLDWLFCLFFNLFNFNYHYHSVDTCALPAYTVHQI